jgi:hypothetical protein
MTVAATPACGRAVVDMGVGADAGATPNACLAQVAGVYDSVFVVRRADGTLWAAPDHSRFVEIAGPAGHFAARDLAVAGSSAYGTAVGCAIVADGAVWCFPVAGPLIHSGDLGAGLGADVTTTAAVQVVTSLETHAPLAHARQLASSMSGAGATFCAVTDAGGLWCWGTGDHALLARGDDADATFARPALANATTPLAAVAEVRLGERSACARQTDGTVWCWGDNHVAELGVVSTTLDAAPFPRRVDLPAPATRLAADPGDTHCAILGDDRVACWGWNATAQAGAVDGLSAVAPTLVLAAAGGPPLRGAFDLAPDRGMQAMCANTTTRGLVCWGNPFPAPGIDVAESPYPVDIPGAGPGAVRAPLASFGARDGALLWIDPEGHLAVGAGAPARTVQPPCESR